MKGFVVFCLVLVVMAEAQDRVRVVNGPAPGNPSYNVDPGFYQPHGGQVNVIDPGFYQPSVGGSPVHVVDNNRPPGFNAAAQGIDIGPAFVQPRPPYPYNPAGTQRPDIGPAFVQTPPSYPPKPLRPFERSGK